MRKLLFFLTFFILSHFSAQIFAETAAWSQGEFGSYVSPVVNLAFKDLTPLEVSRLREDERGKKPGVDWNKEQMAKRDFFFACPGYSFLTGVNFTYNSTAKDRTHSFTCSFFEGADKKLLVKSTCKASEIKLLRNDDKKKFDSCIVHDVQNSCLLEKFKSPAGLQEDYNFDCGSGFVSMALSRKNIVDFKKDPNAILQREYNFLCCEASNLSKVFSPGNCEDSSEFPAGKTFTFSCANGKAIAGIDTKFDKEANDRSFKFKCCELQKN